MHPAHVVLIPCLHSLQGVIEFDSSGDRQNTLVQIEQLRLTDQGGYIKEKIRRLSSNNSVSE